jgi:hypothetical protein
VYEAPAQIEVVTLPLVVSAVPAPILKEEVETAVQLG